MAISLAAELFAQREGWGRVGSMPTTHNNPGDLRHAPGAQHAAGDPDGIGYFQTPNEGWAALERQLELYAKRGYSLQRAVYTFAPPSENRTAEYLDYICEHLGCAPDTPMRAALQIGGSTVNGVVQTTQGAIPWYRSPVQVSQVTTVVSALLAISPKAAGLLGLTTPDQIAAAVQAVFGAVAILAPLVGSVLRARSSIQPLTFTKAGADSHPATMAAIAAPLEQTEEKIK